MPKGYTYTADGEIAGVLEKTIALTRYMKVCSLETKTEQTEQGQYEEIKERYVSGCTRTTMSETPAASTSQSPTNREDSLSHWSRYFKQLTGLGLSAEEKFQLKTEADCEKCELWKGQLMQSSEFP